MKLEKLNPIHYIENLFFTLIGIPSESELERRSSDAYKSRLEHEQQFGKRTQSIPSITELVCSSKRSYVDYLVLKNRKK